MVANKGLEASAVNERVERSERKKPAQRITEASTASERDLRSESIDAIATNKSA